MPQLEKMGQQRGGMLQFVKFVDGPILEAHLHIFVQEAQLQDNSQGEVSAPRKNQPIGFLNGIKSANSMAAFSSSVHL
jgi:hypothetical protein